MSAPATVVLDGASKRFGGADALTDLHMAVEQGTIAALIGPSGSGKTTTVRLITGTYRPDGGRVMTLGADPVRLSLDQRQRLGYLPQQPVLFDSLTLWENLNFHASVNGVRLRRRERLHEVLELVGLDGQEGKLVAESSGGMQRRLALAATLVHRPDLIILDEPTAGIDPILRARFWEHFRMLANDGVTLLVTTQYVGEAAYCDQVGLLADGQLLHYSPPVELCRAAYGGELLRVVTDRSLTEAELAEVGALDGVGASFERVDPTTIAAAVDDAGAAIPIILQWLDGRGIGVVDSEEVAVDYEEVFVRLVERHRETPAGTDSRDETAPDETASPPAPEPVEVAS